MSDQVSGGIGKTAYATAYSRLSGFVPNSQSRKSRALFFGRLACYYSALLGSTGEINTGHTRYSVLKHISTKDEDLVSNHRYYYQHHFKVLEQAGLIELDSDGHVVLIVEPDIATKYYQKMAERFGTDKELDMVANCGPAMLYLFLLNYKNYPVDKAHQVASSIIRKLHARSLGRDWEESAEQDVLACLHDLAPAYEERWSTKAELVGKVMSGRESYGHEIIDRIIAISTKLSHRQSELERTQAEVTSHG